LVLARSDPPQAEACATKPSSSSGLKEDREETRYTCKVLGRNVG
jgi:hypothetical protein